MKKALIITSALMTVMTTTAFAQTMNEPVRHPTARKTTHVVGGRFQAVPQYPDRFTVIENDRIVGRDPDISIRAQLRRDPLQNEY